MKKLSLLAMFFLFLNTSFSQQSLDSLRLVLPVGHSASITKISSSSDGKIIASGNLSWAYWGSNFDEPTDKNVIIWSQQGVPLHILEHSNTISHLSDFSWNNKYILTKSDSTVQIWDVESGELIQRVALQGEVDESDPINFLFKTYDIYYKSDYSLHHISFSDSTFTQYSDDEVLHLKSDQVKIFRTDTALTIFLNDNSVYLWNINGLNKREGPSPNNFHAMGSWIHPLNEQEITIDACNEVSSFLNDKGQDFLHIAESSDHFFFDFSESNTDNFGGKNWGLLNKKTGKIDLIKKQTTTIDYFNFLNPNILYYESNGHYVSFDFFKIISKSSFIDDNHTWSHLFWSDGHIVIQNFGTPMVFDLNKKMRLSEKSCSKLPFNFPCGDKFNCIDDVYRIDSTYFIHSTNYDYFDSVYFDSIYCYKIKGSDFVCEETRLVDFFSDYDRIVESTDSIIEFDFESKLNYSDVDRNFLRNDLNEIILKNRNNNEKVHLHLKSKLNTGGQYTRCYYPRQILFLREDSIFVINETDRLEFFDYSGNSLFSFIPLSDIHFLILLSSGYYYVSNKEVSKFLNYYKSNNKVIGFEQLDPVYNRPDIVLDSIGNYFGNKDQGMIDEYRKSWEKRIDRLGLDKEKLGKGEIAVPNAEILEADAIAYENKNGKLDIKVAANDPKYPLRRFNVYVNEVPLYGSAGISIAHLKKQVWDTTVSVPLSMGENKIQVSVMNELGLENFKYPSYVNYTPSEPIVAKTYYIGIGVNEFKEPGHKLNYCVKDVTDLSMSFGGPNTEVKLFTNAQVTKENILALKDYLAKTTVNDKVIISCSSHGLLDDSLNFYLAMHDVDFNNPKERGLKYEALENLLDGIPARQKLLLLDACNSGENDKTELIKRELEQKNSKMDSTQILAARGVIVKLEDENKSNFKKMNELFVNVRNNTGSVIISAAGGQESALEAITVDGKSIENGAFSYSVLEYLKNNSNKPEELTVNKLKNYVEKRVEEITNGKQQPTSRQETMEVDWRVR
jgi:hypothetical protein